MWCVVGGGGKEAAIRRYREKLEADVLGVCEEVIALLQPLQVASRHDAASLVFLHKMYSTAHARPTRTQPRHTHTPHTTHRPFKTKGRGSNLLFDTLAQGGRLPPLHGGGDHGRGASPRRGKRHKRLRGRIGAG